MKRLILLTLIAIPMALLAVDRLSTPIPSASEAQTARLAFDFPEPADQPHPADSHQKAQPHIATAAETVQVISSDLMANEDRALANLRQQIDAAVADWLAEAGIPRTWQAPRPLVDRLILKRPQVVLAAQRDYGDLYQAEVPVAFQRATKARIVSAYRQDLRSQRLAQLGAVFAFILACLAILAGYIRTDEATRGYYTNHLRFLAAGALGAAGVVLYQFLVT